MESRHFPHGSRSMSPAHASKPPQKLELRTNPSSCWSTTTYSKTTRTPEAKRHWKKPPATGVREGQISNALSTRSSPSTRMGEWPCSSAGPRAWALRCAERWGGGWDRAARCFGTARGLDGDVEQDSHDCLPFWLVIAAGCFSRCCKHTCICTTGYWPPLVYK